MWQSDVIHWPLDDDADAEIFNWLDDHFRYLLSGTGPSPVTGQYVEPASLPPSMSTARHADR